MRNETKQLHTWYATIQNEEDTLNAWADAVMTDPENGIVFTRLGNCAARSVEMMLRLAARDNNPETMERVLAAMKQTINSRE